jgi:hypothetical protein
MHSLADAALAHGLPIRVDQERPGDLLASVQYGARTVARCTYDANPSSEMPPKSKDRPYWLQLGGNALFLRSLAVRPFTDVLWTTVAQYDPRWGHAFRPHVVHDTLSATLTTGPIGFGDLINGTDAVLLARATRVDGNILKPASTALRIDRYYRPAPVGGAEIWAAPTGPAGGATDADDRANSMPPLGEDAAQDGIWWWAILATNVDAAVESGRPLQLQELWPRPAAGTVMLVATIERTGDDAGSRGVGAGCVNGTTVAACGFTMWTEDTPLDIGTAGDTGRNFTLLAAAPVLSSGWVLVGDLTKFVPCSPQRFVAASKDARRAGALHEQDLTPTNAGVLEFVVLGSVGEKVPVTVVSPPAVAGRSGGVMGGVVLVVDVVVGAGGSSKVSCATGRCAVV